MGAYFGGSEITYGYQEVKKNAENYLIHQCRKIGRKKLNPRSADMSPVDLAEKFPNIDFMQDLRDEESPFDKGAAFDRSESVTKMGISAEQLETQLRKKEKELEYEMMAEGQSVWGGGRYSSWDSFFVCTSLKL